MKISADDLVLTLQRAIDRCIRRLRRGGPLTPTHRRFLIVQIDGLSRVVLEQGLDSGRMPFVKRMLERDGYRMETMSVSLPTSTPAFQMATFYGVPPDTPGFHYYSRERQTDIHFPRSGHAAWVETRQASGRRGILRGGSAYGCCFTGGADNNLFTFTSLTKASGRGVLGALSPFVVVTWVAGKNVALTVCELAKEGLRFITRRGQAEPGWQWLKLKLFMSIWVRNFFTMAVSRDLYEGVPAIYVNYLGYDPVRSGQRPCHAGLARSGSIDRTVVERHEAGARAPVRRLHPGRPWPARLHALQRPDGRQAAGALDLRRVPYSGTGRRA